MGEETINQKVGGQKVGGWMVTDLVDLKKQKSLISSRERQEAICFALQNSQQAQKQLAPNASGRRKEDEANDKKCVERMFKKQLSPQSIFPLFFFHVVEAWSFIFERGNRGPLNWQTPGTVEGWAPY